MPDAADPVQEIAELRVLLAEREAELAQARAELTGARLRIEQYKAQLAQLRRMQFGRSSEKLDTQIQQLELMLEDLEESEAARTALTAKRALDQPRRERRQPVRRPLPDHLPREEVVRSARAAAAPVLASSARTSPRSWRRSRPGSR
jgi:transposase